MLKTAPPVSWKNHKKKVVSIIMENKLETKNIFNNMEYVGFDRAMKEIGEMKLKAVALTLTPSGDGLLKVALTKDVPRGAALPLWFSSEAAALLGLPFLNFSHIRGNDLHPRL